MGHSTSPVNSYQFLECVVTAEVMLNVVGLDNLADYSEFVFQTKVIADATEAFSNLITLVS